MRVREFGELFREAGRGWARDQAGSMGAALAFYTLFSMAPLLLLVVSLVALFVDLETARGLVYGQLRELVGEAGAEAIYATMRAADKPQEGVVAAAASLAMLLIGATSVLAELQRDLDRIWGARPPAGAAWKALIVPRLWGFGLVLAIGFLLLVTLMLSAAVSALGSLWGGIFPGAGPAMRLLEFATSFALVTALFAMIYKILPSAKIAWRDVWTGAAITSLLFWVGKWLIGLYLGKAAVASPFGAAGTLIVVILWVYYSSQIFFLGAEFTRAYAARKR